MTTLTVIKQDPFGREKLRYPGQILEQDGNHILLQAYFGQELVQVEDIVLQKSDRFLETYYFDRWYNLFEIHDRDDDHLKGWYCNVSTPAILNGDRLTYRDLALDLVVYPDGRQVVLDQDEFEQLSLSDEIRRQALAALRDLQSHFRARFSPPNP